MDAPAPKVVIEVTSEQFEKVRKLSKLVKSGVPEDAVKARCLKENVEFKWLQANLHVMGTNDVTISDELSTLFRINDEGDIDFINPKAHLTTLVKIFLAASIQRRGQLDIKTGTGTYITVPRNDLWNALGSFQAVQYDRDLYLNSVTGTDENDSIPQEHIDEIRSKRYRFQQHLVSLGIRLPPHQVTNDIIPGLDDLITFMENMKVQHFNEEEDSLTYTFEDLSNIFLPGMKCIARNAVTTGVDCLVQVVWSRYEQGKTLGGIVRRFVVTFQFLCSVCDHYGLAEFTEQILNFENSKRIDSLPFIPITYITKSDELLMQCQSRGVLYQKISRGSHFMGYARNSFFPKSISSSTKSTSVSRSDGRVVIDISGGYESGHSVSTGYDGMILAIQEKTKEFMVNLRQQGKNRSVSIGQASSNSANTDDGPLMMKTIPDYLIELTWPAVTGFSFTCKSWGDIVVDSLFEIEFAEETFDRLVLPPSRKRIIKALVRHSNDSFQDIVSGKGEGSVFLLYGAPGTGKTLTAEAISEMLHRPLYSVSLGQLGTNPAELEKRMGEILDLCSRWDALILLDEADILLEKRKSGGSLERNAMVSVMLRLVEYFKGVLFLTSNRVDSLDPAFRTRITLALRYDALDVAARNKVWQNLLQASNQSDLINSGEINTEELAQYNLNGREIKNCLRLALALAAEDSTRLSQTTLLETVTLVLDFNEKMANAEAY